MHRIHHSLPTEHRPIQSLWSMVEQLDAATTATEVKSTLLDAAACLGLTSLFAGWVPTLDSSVEPSAISARILHDHQPSEWAIRYVQQGFAAYDPIVHRLQTDRAPFSWRDAYQTSCIGPGGARVKDEASSFGLRAGYVVPVTFMEGQTIAFSFGGFDVDADPSALSQLAFLTNYAAGQLLNLVRLRTETPPRALTQKEKECLFWASEGKTDWELAKICGFSRSTAMKHMASARGKLNAVSRTHAVVKAVREKLIS